MARRIPLHGKNGAGLFALVDDADYDRLNARRWHGFLADPASGAIYATSNGEWMHRIVAGAVKGEEVDHRDRDPLNNQAANLRIATRSQNSFNRGLRSDNTTGFKGVVAFGDKFRGVTVLDGRRYHLGTFDDAETAALAYDRAARAVAGEFALTNGIDAPANLLPPARRGAEAHDAAADAAEIDHAAERIVVAAIIAGKTAKEAADAAGLRWPGKVVTTCARLGVGRPMAKRLRPGTTSSKAVALMSAGARDVEVAGLFGVSRQRAQQIRLDLFDRGLYPLSRS